MRHAVPIDNERVKPHFHVRFASRTGFAGEYVNRAVDVAALWHCWQEEEMVETGAKAN